MQWNSARITLRTMGLVSLTIAAVAPWAGVIDFNRQGASTQKKYHRKTTDAPVASTGKLGTELFLAIDHRDLKEVKSLLAKGADPNSRNGLEFTPLYIAAASWQPEAMQALIDAGAETDAESPYGTPLTFAAISGHARGAKMLLAKGANPQTARVDGTTVLMMAAQAGNPELIAELVKHKANVQAKNVTGATALSYAARAGHAPVGKLLLDAGASVDGADMYKQTPLMIAAMCGHADVVKLLLSRGAKVDALDSKGRSALLLAARYGDYPEVVSELKAAGANLNLKDEKGRTAAELALARGYSKTAEALGATGSAETPLPSAVKSVQSSLTLLQNSMKEFSKNTGCISCHQEGLGRMATASARSRGFTIDKEMEMAQKGRINGMIGFLQPLHEKALANAEAMKQLPLIEMNEVSTGYGWLFAGMMAQNDPANAGTAAAAMVLGRQQTPAGNWGFSLPRVPMQSSPFTYTAFAVKTLQTYGPKASAKEIDERVAKAKAWLMATPAKTSDDLAFRLMGLKWAGASMDERKTAIDELLAAQLSDGGWAQMPGLHSDAYATGQALYALTIAGGIATTDPVYAKGTTFLLRTQDDDGSWFVSKRAIPANNYFDAAFPYGESQYASFNATCWAMLALLETLPKK